MATVSNFELIFKAQSPAGPADSGPSDVPIVLQGYFLQITNLSSARAQYGVFFNQTPPEVEAESRTLAERAATFVDDEERDSVTATFGGNVSDQFFILPQGLIAIQPESTALVAVLPRAFDTDSPIFPGSGETPAYEVRGFVSVASTNVIGGGSGTRTLFAPQFRATYLTFGNAPGAFSVVGQTQGAVPLASGEGAILV